ncbi:MAG: MerR family transcriptional regulator [Firmicutes bacterium]|nr:MerR family transcriptional regulator [Bacillota bacterium]
MKINQVEELVGITKKNIRFYESQGLLNPNRDPENGYREYTLEDVRQLERVKLLRKLDIPCEQIRNVMDGKLTLSACVKDQQEALEKRGSDLQRMQELCNLLSEEAADFDSLDAAAFLENMRKLEQGGVRFVDTSKSDVKKRRTGAIVSAVVCILYFAALGGLMFLGNSVDPIPPAVLIFLILIPIVMIVGITLALRQRMKEIKGGELDEARKY